MIKHLLKTKLSQYQTRSRLLVESEGWLKSKLNHHKYQSRVVVHEGLLQLEMYQIEGLVAAAKEHKFNFFVKKFDAINPRVDEQGLEIDSQAEAAEVKETDIDIFFDYGILQKPGIRKSESLWVAPIDISLGLGALNTYLRHIATVKLKSSILRSMGISQDKNTKMAYAERYLEADKRKNELFSFSQKMPESFGIDYTFIPKENYTQVEVLPNIYQTPSRPFTEKLFLNQGSRGPLVRLASHLMAKEVSSKIN